MVSTWPRTTISLPARSFRLSPRSAGSLRQPRPGRGSARSRKRRSPAAISMGRPPPACARCTEARLPRIAAVAPRAPVIGMFSKSCTVVQTILRRLGRDRVADSVLRIEPEGRRCLKTAAERDQQVVRDIALGEAQLAAPWSGRRPCAGPARQRAAACAGPPLPATA